MMTGLTEEIRQYVIDRSEAYKRDSEDHYDFWNEHIRYVYKEAMMLARKYHADETIVGFIGKILDIRDFLLVNLQYRIIAVCIGTVRVEKGWNDRICAVLWLALHWKGKDA